MDNIAFINNIINYDYIGFLSNIFQNITFEAFLKGIIIYFFIVWIAIIVWVTRDIINRTNNIFYQIFSILTVLLLTPFGIVIYLFIRPSKTLFEKYYEESSIEDEGDNYENTFDEEKLKCFNCSYDIKSDYKFCPNCRIQIKKDCISCSKEIKPDFSICPYCGKDQENKIENILKSPQSENKIKDKKENNNKKTK